MRRKDRAGFEGLAAYLTGQMSANAERMAGARVATQGPPTPVAPTPLSGPAGQRSPTPEPTVEGVLAQLTVVAPDGPLDEQIEVNGETYYSKSFRKLFRAAGMPITTAGTTLRDLQCVLVPEPWNEHDPHAVAVTVEGYLVGHVPAKLALHYSPRLLVWAQRKQLVAGRARVWAKEDDGMLRARVTILVPELELL